MSARTEYGCGNLTHILKWYQKFAWPTMHFSIRTLQAWGIDSYFLPFSAKSEVLLGGAFFSHTMWTEYDTHTESVMSREGKNFSSSFDISPIPPTWERYCLIGWLPGACKKNGKVCFVSHRHKVKHTHTFINQWINNIKKYLFSYCI